jgi:ribonuclease HII
VDEVQRIKRLMEMENQLRREGFWFIAGVDEVGRGPLAGPVFASACILPGKFDLPGLNDSKKLSAKKREYLAEKIKEQAVAFALGSASAAEIDRINILQASKLAMKRALANLSVSPDFVLVDGRDRLNIDLPHRPVIGGDGLCAGIAAASILAKVARDKLMDEIHEIYPQYCFDQHKGYGTALHLELIAKFGPCPIHRRSFSPIKEMLAASQDRLG